MPRRESINEAWVKRQVKRLLKENKVWYFMPQAGPYGNSGIPDFICCANGKFLGIETKANGNKPTELQSAVHEDIRKSKGTVVVIDEHNLDVLATMLPIFLRRTDAS